MNTTDNRIQWHSAFEASLQIELEQELEYLTFEAEHLLAKKPLQIDVLVIKKERNIAVQKNIGRIFRMHNIIEYKSPDDELSIDDFYKVYGYACIYKSEARAVNKIPVDQITITLVCYHYPIAMLRRLEGDRNIRIEQVEAGIYYLKGDFLPIQLIIIPQLSVESNYWMNHLRRNLKSSDDIRDFLERYEKRKNSKLHQALADVVVRANWKKMEGEKMMCEALRELFADELRESKMEGELISKIQLTVKKYKKGYQVEETADMLEETPENIRQIYNAIESAGPGPDYDEEQIYQAIRDKLVIVQ